MSEMNTATPPPDKTPAIRASRFAGRATLARTALLGSVLVAGVALGAGGLAAASAHGLGWMGGGGGWSEGSRLERIQGFSRRILDGVGATSTQQAKIHDIVAATYGEVTKLRADHIAMMDAKSKTLVTALADIAETLTPEQRVKLADRAEQMAARGPRHGGWMGHGMRHGMGPGAGKGPGQGQGHDGMNGGDDDGPDAPPPPPPPQP
jgi:periplasmic protein CpxP/Spy